MSAQAQLDYLFNTLNVSEEHQNKLDELRSSFDEDHVEVFLEKLEAIDNIDEILEISDEDNERSNQFIDFISSLIISK